MKRKQYKATLHSRAGEQSVITYSHNSAIRAGRNLIKALNPDERTVYELEQSTYMKDKGVFTHWREVWINTNNGARATLTIECLG